VKTRLSHKTAAAGGMFLKASCNFSEVFHSIIITSLSCSRKQLVDTSDNFLPQNTKHEIETETL